MTLGFNAVQYLSCLQRHAEVPLPEPLSHFPLYNTTSCQG
jgi:hypothetical protein